MKKIIAFRIFASLLHCISLYGTITLCFFPFNLIAGGSPENTLVVVNARSPLSTLIANEYVQLRGIPDNHVVWLNEISSMDTISIEDFRNKIWLPIKTYIDSHQLQDEIDIIAYSGDFPYAVDFSSDLNAQKIKKHKYLGNIASLTSLTYFAHRVAAKDLGYLNVNYYFRDFGGPKRTKSNRPVSQVQLKEKEVSELKKEAQKFLNQKDTESAIKNYYKILESFPDDPLNWYNLARAQATADDREKAMESLTLAVDSGWTNSIKTSREQAFKTIASEIDFQNLLKRMDNAYGPFLLTSGFRHHYVWSNPDLTHWEPADSLNQYYLSTMLAYTGVRGNSFPEIKHYLDTSAKSDGSHPDGSVYLLENSNIRSTTRQALFPVTLKELSKRQRNAEVLYKGLDKQNGILPIEKSDVVGAVIGYVNYQWEKTRSQIMPGAIVETLTSYGGHFNLAKQTKLTEFLRYGAAGSSGAVTEPFAFQEKFPVPLIHAWYADGCSLAESFYQSIKIPYQLIVVGDPLARPFASFTKIKLKSAQSLENLSGTVTFEPSIQPAPDKEIKKMEFWLDGHYQFDLVPNKTFSWDTTTIADGSHEIRLIGVEDSTIETRSSSRFNIKVFNNPYRVEIKKISQPISYGDNIELNGTAAGAEKIELFHGYRLLTTADVRDSQWRINLPAKEFGIGPVSFFMKASFPNGNIVWSDPVNLEIGFPGSINPVLIEKPNFEGLNARIYDTQGEVHHLIIKTLDGLSNLLNKKKLKIKQIQLDGYLYIAKPGFYQFAVTANGHPNITLNDQILLDKNLPANKEDTYIPVNLNSGWFKLSINYENTGKPFLKMILGGEQIPEIVGGDRLAHHSTEL